MLFCAANRRPFTALWLSSKRKAGQFGPALFAALGVFFLTPGLAPALAQQTDAAPQPSEQEKVWQPSAVPEPVPVQETPAASPPAGDAPVAENAAPEPPPAFEDYPTVRLQSLDKVTARTMTFQARVGATVKFGPIYIKTRSCRKPPIAEKPEAAAFLQIWEDNIKTGEPRWIFSGWMFASSPALSAMDHPIYDVWVLDCIADPATSPPAPDTAAPEEPEKKDDRTDKKG